MVLRRGRKTAAPSTAMVVRMLGRKRKVHTSCKGKLHIPTVLRFPKGGGDLDGNRRFAVLNTPPCDLRPV